MSRKNKSSKSQMDEVEEPQNEILESYKTNAIMIEATLKKLRRRNKGLLHAYFDALSDLESMHRTSLCVERFLAPSLKEKIKERDALQAQMDATVEDGSDSFDFDGNPMKSTTEPLKEKGQTELHTLEKAANISSAPLEKDVKQPHTLKNSVLTSEAPVDKDLKELPAIDETTDASEKDVENKIIIAERKTLIAERLKNIKAKLKKFRKHSEDSMRTLPKITEDIEMGKCFNAHNIEQRKTEELIEAAKSKDKENQKALQEYESEQCELKQEMFTVYEHVHATKLKESNVRFHKRMKQLELDLMVDMDTISIVDAKIKRIAENIAKLTVENRVMESRIDELPQVEKTCEDFGKVLECRQRSLADKEDRIGELRKVLSEKIELNMEKLYQKEERSKYVKAARRTINECTWLIKKAMKGIACADFVNQTSSSVDSKTSVSTPFSQSHLDSKPWVPNKLNKPCLDSKKSELTKPTRFCFDSEFFVQNAPTKSFDDSKTLQQSNLTDCCDNSGISISSKLVESCEDSKYLVRTVLAKLRHLLPLIGDPVTSLSYMLRNDTADNTADLRSFSILDLQMYQRY